MALERGVEVAFLRARALAGRHFGFGHQASKTQETGSSVFMNSTAHDAAWKSGESPSDPLTEPFDNYNAKELRKEVSRLKLKVVRKGPDANAHKQGYMALLRAHYQICASQPSTASNVPMRADTQAKSDDIVIRMLHLLFSAELWRSFVKLHYVVSEKNKSMLSNTVTSPSIDMYGPKQSTEAHEFWNQVAIALEKSASAGMEHANPDALFSFWTRVCEHYNTAKSLAVQDDGITKPDLVCLITLLRQRPELTSLVQVGQFFSTFDPIVPPESGNLSLASQISDSDLAFATDDDSEENSQQSHDQDLKDAQDATSALALEHPDVVDLQRDFWESKKTLVNQNIENARLQFKIQQTAFLEERLSGSKRKIQALRDELRAVDHDSAEAAPIAQELNFYVHERKRVLLALTKSLE